MVLTGTTLKSVLLISAMKRVRIVRQAARVTMIAREAPSVWAGNVRTNQLTVRFATPTATASPAPVTRVWGFVVTPKKASAATARTIVEISFALMWAMVPPPIRQNVRILRARWTWTLRCSTENIIAKQTTQPV